MKNYKVITPLMLDISAHTINAKGNNIAEAKADALIDYNSSRAHDGLPPLEKLPRGTRIICDKKIYINSIRHGYHETVSTYSLFEHGADYRKEARKDLSEYRMSDPSSSFELSTRYKGYKS